MTGNRLELGPELAYNLDPFGETRRQVESQRAPRRWRVTRHSTPT